MHTHMHTHNHAHTNTYECVQMHTHNAQEHGGRVYSDPFMHGTLDQQDQRSDVSLQVSV